MTYDYAAKGRADALAGLRDDKLYETMLPHGEAYRNAHRLTRIGAAVPAQAAALAVETPSDEPTWVAEPPPQAKDEPPEVVPPAPATSNEVEKTHAPEPDRTVGRPEPAVARAPEPFAGGKPAYRVPLMREIAALPRNGFRAISTFSGCGGSSLGYKIAGFEVLWASEFVPSAQETYRANHPGTILDLRDIRDVKVEDILEATKTEPGELDLFDGSPPCASFSTAGIREDGWGRVKKYSDTKQRTDYLFFEFARLVKGVQAKVFVAENVAGLTVGVAKGMLGDGQIDAFQTQEDTILHTLMDCGYRVGFHVLDAADLGVPQARRRVIFVGIRKDLAARFNLEPVWPRALPWRYTIREALEAPLPPEFDVPGVDISKYAIGREWDNLKPGEQSEKYFSLVKVHPDDVCPTICASHGSGSIASIAHWSEKRKFSIGELRRLGGFPDDFKLEGSYEQQWERIGRAVPPIMMGRIAATIRDEILEKIRAGTPAPVVPPAPAIEVKLEAAPEPAILPRDLAPEIGATVAEGQLELFL